MHEVFLVTKIRWLVDTWSQRRLANWKHFIEAWKWLTSLTWHSWTHYLEIKFWIFIKIFIKTQITYQNNLRNWPVSYTYTTSQSANITKRVLLWLCGYWHQLSAPHPNPHHHTPTPTTTPPHPLVCLPIYITALQRKSKLQQYDLSTEG